MPSADNLVLDDLDLAVEEIAMFQAAGGRTVVDCTSVGIHRDPRRLLAIAQRTGLNVIAGCGYYTQDTHPPEMTRWSIDTIAEANAPRLDRRDRRDRVGPE